MRRNAPLVPIKRINSRLNLKRINFRHFLRNPVSFFGLTVKNSNIRNARRLKRIRRIAKMRRNSLLFPPLFTMFTTRILNAMFNRNIRRSLLLRIRRLFSTFMNRIRRNALPLRTRGLLSRQNNLNKIMRTRSQKLRFLRRLPKNLRNETRVLR